MTTSSIEFRRPGAVVHEVPLPRDAQASASTAARAVLSGVLPRGPIEPTVISSWHQFQNIFGSWTGDDVLDNTVDAAYTYFSSLYPASSALIVLRCVRDDATVAHVDVPAVPAVAPAAGVDPALAGTTAVSFRAEAVSPGAWGNRIRISVANETTTYSEFTDQFTGEFSRTTTIAPGFRLTISLVDEADKVVGIPEQYYNLSNNPLSREYVVAIVNESSNLVRLRKVDPILDTGVNPSASDPASTWDTVAKKDVPLAPTGGSDGVGQVAVIPKKLDAIEQPLTIYHASRTDSNGTPKASEVAEFLDYAQARKDSFVICDTPRVGQVIQHAAIYGSGNAYGAVYYPWIKVADPQRGPTSITKTVPPGGAVLGTFMGIDATYGPWRTPAGVAAQVRPAVDLDRKLSEEELQALNSAIPPVNALRVIPGAGVCIMGGRTLNQTNADRYIAIRRSLNFISVNLQRIAEGALFEPNGPDLWLFLTTRMENWLGQYYQAGALRGNREPDAFYILCDSTNNTPSTIAAGEVHIEVGVAVEFPAEFVIIRLTQHQGAVRS